MQKKPPLRIQTTTLWDYPSQHYGEGMQGDKAYAGATPSYIIWNLLQRYTKPQDLVIDPCCGSGTTIAVGHELNRKVRGFDLQPYSPEIELADGRQMPLADRSVDFVFVDPPYSTHLEYSDDPRCIGKLDAADGTYYSGMKELIHEIHRVLKDGKYMALYVSDSFKKGKPFMPIGFELFNILNQYFEPIDIIAVTRHNAKLAKGNFHKAAEEENFFLRGFNYLFIMRKSVKTPSKPQKTNYRNHRQHSQRNEVVARKKMVQDQKSQNPKNQNPKSQNPKSQNPKNQNPNSQNQSNNKIEEFKKRPQKPNNFRKPGIGSK